MKIIKLSDSLTLPLLGFGVWQLQGDEAYNSVVTALETGYRHIDTADRYGNHLEVAKALSESGLKREEFFITTKTPQPDLSKETILTNGQRFLEELEVDYIDLLLIHWPNREHPISESLEAMQELKEKGMVKEIGVSNFTIHHLQDCLETGVRIVNNQVELRPSFNQKELRDWAKEHDITITSYSTIKGGIDFDDPTIQELKKKYGKSEAQIILNWAIMQDIIVIPRSTKPERIKDNFAAADWEMEKEDIDKMNQIPQKGRQTNNAWSDFDY